MGWMGSEMVATISILMLAAELIGSANQSEYNKDNPDPIIAEIEKVGSESKTVVDLSIDATGHVARCVVIESSGSEYLDQAACKTFSEKAKFAPKLDPATKKPVKYLYRSRIIWRLEE
jgi:TonB family protein